MSENKNPRCPTCESELQEVNAGWYCKRCNVIVVFQDVLRFNIDELESRLRWIPESNPPKESDFYLVRYEGYRVPNTDYYDVDTGWMDDVKPDYWMPIPELPKVKNELR